MKNSMVSAQRFRRTREDHSRETAEDYVELIDTLMLEKGEARVVDLAEALGISQVTVSKTIQRLMKEGFVTAKPYRSIFLTQEGRSLAQASRARHELVLNFLKKLGVPNAIAETDAEGIEHHVSEQTLQAMRRFLRQPAQASPAGLKASKFPRKPRAPKPGR